MKKFQFLTVGLASLFIAGVLGACTNGEGDPGGDKPGTVPDIELELPERDDIIPLPEDVPMPAKPSLPAVDAAKAPYIGKAAVSDQSYTLSGDAENGYTVSYTAAKDYHFIYFDIYNYTSDYHYIRFDLSEISGAEKIAVSAMYMEAFETGVPPVGVLVESMMDGAMSYVTDLDYHKTIDKNYAESTEALSGKTVCRLLVYLDSNPSQSPSDRAGSLKIDKISFLKEGDPAIKVDNSPRVGEATSGGGYTLTKPEGKVFSASYTPSELTASSEIVLPVSRFTSAYGTIKLTYTATGAETLKLTDGSKTLGSDLVNAPASYENYALSSSGVLTVDIRGWRALNRLVFTLDGGKQGSDARTFTLESVEFVVTPYVADDWYAAANYNIFKHAMGGTVTAAYDVNVGFEKLTATVMNWTPEFNVMIIKLKTSGADGGAKFLGLEGNKSTNIFEAQYTPISGFDKDADGVYTIRADLSAFTKLTALNFYFDPWAVNSQLFPEQYFSGNRIVEILSITFGESTGEPVLGQLHNSYEPGGYTLSETAEGTLVSWDENRPEWDYIVMNVSGRTKPENYPYLHIIAESKGDALPRFGVHAPATDVYYIEAATMKSGENEYYARLPETLGTSFALNFYFNGGNPNTTGSVLFKTIEFVSSKPKTGTFEAPTGLTVEGGVLSWTASPNAVSYTVKINDDETTVVEALSLDLSTVRDLLHVGANTLAVKANETDDYYESAYADGASYKMLAAPQNLQIDGTVLTWTAEAEATEFTVKINGDETTVVGEARLDLAEKTGLLQVGSNSISVKAGGANVAESEYSESISYDVADAFAAPAGLTVEGTLVKWNAVDGAETYIVKIGSDETTEVSQAQVDLAEKTELLVHGANEISVKVKGTDEKAGSGYSAPVTYYHSTPFAAPTGLTVEEGFIRWDAVTDAESYTVKINDHEMTAATNELALSEAEEYLTLLKNIISVKANANPAKYYLESEYSVEYGYRTGGFYLEKFVNSEADAYTVEDIPSENKFAFTWADNRGQFSFVEAEVHGFTGKYIKFTVQSERTYTFGVWSDSCLLDHTDGYVGTDTFYVRIPEEKGSEFKLQFYLNSMVEGNVLGGHVVIGYEQTDTVPAAPEGFRVKIHNNKYGYYSYDIALTDEGTSVSWEDGRVQYNYVLAEVSGFDAETYAGIRLIVKAEAGGGTLGITTAGGAFVHDYAAVSAGSNNFDIPSEKLSGLGSDFTLQLYFNSNLSTISAGSVVITYELIEKSEGPIIDGPKPNPAQSDAYTIEDVENGKRISWTADRAEWGNCYLAISGRTAGYKFIKMTLNSETDVKFGVYDGATYWYGPEHFSGEKTIFVPIPDAAGESFNLELYFNAGDGAEAVGNGSVTITNIVLTETNA